VTTGLQKWASSVTVIGHPTKGNEYPMRKRSGITVGPYKIRDGRNSDLRDCADDQLRETLNSGKERRPDTLDLFEHI
jgi:hypothetical protein